MGRVLEEALGGNRGDRFLTVEVWTLGGLVRYHVLFVILLATRKVHIAGIIPEPNGEWMKQIARNLTDCEEGFLVGCKRLIHYSGETVNKRFQRDPGERRSEDAASSATISRFECIRRALGSKDQRKLLGSNDSDRRDLTSTGGRRVRRTLQHGTGTPIIGEQDHRAEIR